MKKKIIIFLIIVGIFLVITGLLWWQKDKIENFLEKKEMEKIVALAKDYSILKKTNEEFIINKKDNLRVKIPTNWKTEIGMDMFGLTSEQHVTLYSEDFSYRPPNGCLIEIQISRLREEKIENYDGFSQIFLYEGAKEVKKMINSYKKALPKEKEGIKIITVDQNEALEEIRILNKNIGKRITVKIPTENRVYIFEGVLFSEKCFHEFDKFLKNISIK